MTQRDRILAEIAETEALTELLEKKRKELQAMVRSTRKTRFYGLDRRQIVQPGWGCTIDEMSASLGFNDDRACRAKMEKRGVFIDDELNGFILTSDFLTCQEEYVRQCRANESD